MSATASGREAAYSEERRLAMLARLRGRLFTVAVGSKDYSHARFVCESSRTVLQLMQTLRDGRDASFRS